MIEAVYLAQREALKVPEDDRQIRYIEHRPERFAVPPDKTQDYTYVEILLFPGRSLQAKRALYRSIVERFAALDNWGIRGGQPASEVDLGFSLNV